VIAGLEEITYENGYNLVICQSNESYEREVECVQTLITQQVNCIVISVTADFKDDQHIRDIQKHGIQLIQFDRVADDVDTLKVLNDNKQSSIEAITHLIEQGYKRIALLEGPQNLNIFRQRKEGYLEALAMHGFEVDHELVRENAWTQELSAGATRELLSLPNPPDAIFASTSDFSALGVLEVATKMGFRVPGQLGICGYSNEAFTEITSPSITTIDQHSVEMGNAIAKLYFKEAKSEAEVSVPKIINIKPQLIIRESTIKN
ncbi:MAG TPA: substrate-binding domain-containing protein, partial [Pedobacter sp.]|nr:substrate-binding domain-containing protein [Pedobacter sp.]